MLLMIDNYDSFTYNLVQCLYMLGEEVQVVRNDALTVEQCLDLHPDGIIISPGPGRPPQAGISVPLIRASAGTIPLLGVCLGHQSIAEAFGGRIVQAKRLMHGKVSQVEHDGDGLFAGMRAVIKATRYHSLAVDETSLPGCLRVTARAEDGEIMGLRHAEHCTVGVQFHPESVMTPAGKRLLGNFLKIATDARNAHANEEG